MSKQLWWIMLLTRQLKQMSLHLSKSNVNFIYCIVPDIQNVFTPISQKCQEFFTPKLTLTLCSKTSHSITKRVPLTFLFHPAQ